VLPLGPGLHFIRDGKVLALAVADQRSPLVPEVPAMSEVVPKYERSGAYGMLAPAGTPRAVLHQINQALRRVLDLPDVKARLQTMTFVTALTTPEEYEKIVRGDIENFGRMLKIAGLRK
jgi:tripartite-type tricarboxylate transporter receptor subunit TctC